jgi:hypothetical protein
MAPAGSTKAVVFGSNLTGDAPVKTMVVWVAGLTGAMTGTGTGTGTGRTGSSVLTDGPWPGCGPGGAVRGAGEFGGRGLPSRRTGRRLAGCLIVDPAGNVLQPTGAGYISHGNCLKEPIDDIWARIPSPVTIIENKRWLSVLAN